MFLENRCKQIYDAICERARNRCLSVYTEKHHVIPKSLGGTNQKDNLVQLTAREHFIAHLCLVRCTEGENKKKMVYAAFRLANGRRNVRVTSRIYQSLKENLVPSDLTKRRISKSMKGKRNRFGTTTSAETRQSLSLIRRGIPKSQQHKEAIRQAHLGKSLSIMHIEAIRKAQTGKILSEQHKQHIRDGMLRRHRGEQACA